MNVFGSAGRLSPPVVTAVLLSVALPGAVYASQVLSPPVTAAGSSAAPTLSASNSGAGLAVRANAAGNALQAVSAHQNGVLGITQFAGATKTNNGAGVYGYDGTSSANNQGVTGRSISGTGLRGISTTNATGGVAINALANGGAGVISTVNGTTDNSGNCGRPAFTGVSAFASAALADSSKNFCAGIAQANVSVGVAADGGFGVIGNGHEQAYGKGLPGIGVEGIGDIGGRFVADGSYVGAPYIHPTALEVEQDGSGLVITAQGTGGGLSLDNAGNLIISGSLTQHGTPATSSRYGASLNRAVLAADVSAPTVEEVGEGRIAGGAGYVRFPAALAQSIDAGTRYQVFITPEGPSAGMYVTDKTLRGFAVRENPGGRSTVDFSYRIVAKAAPEPGTQARAAAPARLNRDAETRALAQLRSTAQSLRRKESPKN